MKKNTLTKLVALATVLLVSVGTIAGSTVAWFTDTEYAINTIQSGSLDVGLEYTTKEMYDESGKDSWTKVVSDTPIFKQGALYEPGYTEVVFLRVSNLGDLDLKYKLAVQAADTQTGESLIEDPVEKNTVLELSDYLKVAAFEVEKAKADENSEATFETAIENWNKATENGDGTTTSARAKVRAEIGDTVSNLNPDENTSIPFLSKGTALTDSEGGPVLNSENFPIYEVDLFKNEDGSAKTFNLLAKKDATDTTEAVAAGENVIGLVLYMPEEVGNEANNRGANKPEIEIGIFLEATQMVSESDSYGDDYDADAQFANTNLYTADRTTSSDNNNTGGTTLEPQEFIIDGIIYRTIVENGVVLDVVEVAGYNPKAEEIPTTVTIGSYIVNEDSEDAQALADYITANNPDADFEEDNDISIWRIREAAWPEGITKFVLNDQYTEFGNNAFPTGSTIDILGGWLGETIPTDAFSVNIKENTDAKYVVHFGFGEDSNFDHTAWADSNLKSALDAAGYEAGTHYTVEFSDGWVINKGAEDPMPAVITTGVTEVTANTDGLTTTVTSGSTKAVKVSLAEGATSGKLTEGQMVGVNQLELPASSAIMLDKSSLAGTGNPFVLIAHAGITISYDENVEDDPNAGPFGASVAGENRFFLYTGTSEEEMSTLWSGLSNVGFTNAYYYDVKNNVYTHYATVTMP